MDKEMENPKKEVDSCEGCRFNEEFTGICTNKTEKCVDHDKYAPILCFVCNKLVSEHKKDLGGGFFCEEYEKDSKKEEISNDHTMLFEIKHKLNPEKPHPYLELAKELNEVCDKHLGSFLLGTTLKEKGSE